MREWQILRMSSGWEREKVRASASVRKILILCRNTSSHQEKAQIILLNCSKLFAMSTTKTRKRKVKQAPKGVAVYKKMLEDKKTIRKHLEKGGTFKELKEKGYHFATV